MKTVALTTAMLLVIGPTIAAAAPTCNGFNAFTTTSALTTAINSKMVCVGSAGNWQAQEFHHSGTIDEYKKGPTDAVDPSKTNYGSYTTTTAGSGATTRATITYSYGGQTAGTYMVATNGTAIYFCSSASGAGAMQVTGVLKGSSLSSC